jgi:hypothetical protein
LETKVFIESLSQVSSLGPAWLPASNRLSGDLSGCDEDSTASAASRLLSDNLAAVWIRDARRAVVVGTALLSGADRLPGSQEYRGVTLVSDDSGVTWKRTVHSMLSLQTVCGWSDVVLAAGPEGAVSSRDGGQTFTPSKSVEVRGFTDCVFLSEREALGVDGGGVLRSDDGGPLEWSSGVGGAWEPQRSGASDLAAVAATAGLAIAVGTSRTILTLAP